MLSIKQLVNKIDATITKRSTSIMETRAKELKDSFLNTLREWKAEVRMLLDIKHIEGVTSTGAYPRKRTGDLRKSLSYRSAKIIRKKTPRSILFRVIVEWDKNPHQTVNGIDYGELLNSGDRFKGSTFFGWKDRTYDLLKKRIKQSIR
jgi:hypothetical protein